MSAPRCCMILHNGTQLMLSVMLFTIIVYIYTEIMFNFLWKFYLRKEHKDIDNKCQDMLDVFRLPSLQRLSAGGGIGEEIDPFAADHYEVFHVIFDIMFYFVILSMNQSEKLCG